MAVQYRASKYLEGIGDTGIGTDNHFGEVNLREVQKVCSSMFSDISKVYGCDDPKKLYPEVLNKNNVVKAQMAEWLYTAIELLNQCCLPLMSSARTTIEQLQEEKINDQRTIIELQEKLISKGSFTYDVIKFSAFFTPLPPSRHHSSSIQNPP